MATTPPLPFFAPQLFIPAGVSDISFYITGLGATELRRFSNDDGTIHVSELQIGLSIFHLHEERATKGQITPTQAGGITSLVGLFVDDVAWFMERAIAAGASLINPAQDYDYGYRQGEVKDPFGHVWLIQQTI